MSLVRALVLAMLRFNFVFYAIHVPGVEKVLADALSRDQVGLFKRLHPQAMDHPSTIPQHLLPGGVMADVRNILQRSLSPATWSKQLGPSTSILGIPPALPVLPFQAVMFLASLHQKGLAASTIRSAGSAISLSARHNGLVSALQVSSRAF